MQAFHDLFNQLDTVTGTRAKVATLVDYFRGTPSSDAAWTLSLLLGKHRRRLITGRRLRDILRDRGGMPDWLMADCYSQVGDSAETISLLWPSVEERIPVMQGCLPEPLEDRTLHWWMATLLPAITELDNEAQADALLQLWQTVPKHQHLVVNKLLTGGFRVGVSTGLISRAVAEAFHLEESLVVQRLMGGFTPSATGFDQLTAPEDSEERLCRGTPYPFFLASGLDPERINNTSPADWLLEWKWDGIRGQLIHRGSKVYLWSRGEELVNASFPELVDVGSALPPGTVLDGEVICWQQDSSKPLGFDQLQRRLGRKQVGSLLKRECPVRFIAYDLLEKEGMDIRDQPLNLRLDQLKCVMADINHEQAWRLVQSRSWPLDCWEALDDQRELGRLQNAEGLMLKHRESPYLNGRKRGYWWKYKHSPMTLDAVLLYAQAGSGRRANLFTDYTFGLWSDTSELKIVSFAKAYSGLNDEEILELDRWIRTHTIERFGPTRSVKPELVFEIAFEGIHPSKRHKSGVAVRFPRIHRWRKDKPAEEADHLQSALSLIRNDEADKQAISSL